MEREEKVRIDQQCILENRGVQERDTLLKTKKYIYQEAESGSGFQNGKVHQSPQELVKEKKEKENVGLYVQCHVSRITNQAIYSTY